MPGLPKEVIISLNTFSASLFLSLTFCSFFSSLLFMMYRFLKSEIKVIDHVSNLRLSLSSDFLSFTLLYFSVLKFSFDFFLNFHFSPDSLHLSTHYYLYFLKYIYKSCLSHFFANPRILGFSVTVLFATLFSSSHTSFFLHIFLLYTEHCQ